MLFHRILAMPHPLWRVEIPRTGRISTNENPAQSLVIRLWITFRLALLLLFNLWITPYRLALAMTPANSGRS